MSTHEKFIQNLIDKNGRPLYLPVGSDIPDGATQVSDETYQKIITGAPRIFAKDGKYVIRQGYQVWAPSFDPGEGWEEITDPDEYQRVLDQFNG